QHPAAVRGAGDRSHPRGRLTTQSTTNRGVFRKGLTTPFPEYPILFRLFLILLILTLVSIS
ncbi:hypothetical protein, partial [Pseudomonas aeruginosa]|uniref:hypothetical protein n=1 Tax=Pseudomonas aeruginosa TaxID=287 RepID=UPI00295387AA